MLRPVCPEHDPVGPEHPPREPHRVGMEVDAVDHEKLGVALEPLWAAEMSVVPEKI